MAGNQNSGRGGLPPATRREIIRRLATGAERNVRIARDVGVGVSTVQRINRQVAQRGVATIDEETTARCPCGALVLLEVGYCVSCWFRKTHGAIRPIARAAK